MVPYRVHSSFVSDVFLAECTVHGVAEVQFPYDPAYSESGLHPLTSAVAFEFCFAAGERGKTRTLHVACIGMAVNFIEQVVQVRKFGTNLPAILFLRKVRKFNLYSL